MTENPSSAPSLDAQADVIEPSLQEWHRTNLVNVWLYEQNPTWGPMGRLDKPVQFHLHRVGVITQPTGPTHTTPVGAHLAARLRAAQLAKRVRP